MRFHIDGNRDQDTPRPGDITVDDFVDNPRYRYPGYVTEESCTVRYPGYNNNNNNNNIYLKSNIQKCSIDYK